MSESQSEQLLPCPFCGNEAARVDIPNIDPHEGGDSNAGGSYIHCLSCGVSGPINFGEKECLYEQWNYRVAEEGSSKCPICDKDSPHYHAPEEATMYNAKFVGIGPQYVQDAIQEVYAAMDAMRRKGARENQDIGYNAGFNVSADILEAAIKKMKDKLGFMADRVTPHIQVKP